MNKFSKIFVSIITAIFLFANVNLAFAQLTDVPTSNSALGTGGIAGSIANTAAEAAFKAAGTINEGCVKAEEAFSKVDHGTEFAFGGLSLIGGSASEMAYLESKAVKIEGFLTCRQRARDTLKGMMTPNLITSQKKQRLEEEINLAVDGLNKRKQDIQARQNIAKRGFWKSLVIKMLLSTTKAVTNKLVNNLTHKFKINNYLDYTDAVASQVYTVQQIRNNVKDGGDQLIARSIVTNPLVRDQIQPAVFHRADKALGFDPDDLDLMDPNFYQKGFQVGSGKTNAFLGQVKELDKGDNMRAQSLETAKAEISHGSGFKASRTCHGNLAEQAAIDREYQGVNNEIENRAKLLAGLQNYKTVARDLTPQEIQRLNEDIKKADADFERASQKLSDLPKKYKSPVLEICNAMDPAELVNKGIDKAFGQFAGKMGDYNDNNLPFFMNFISDLGSQIGNSLIFGGSVGQTLLKESGGLAQAASLGIGLAKNEQAEKNLAKGVKFDPPEKNNNFSDSYTLSWEVVDVKDADYVTIKGTGISDAQHLPLSGSVEVRTSANSTYLLKVFDKAGKMLTSVSQDLEVESTNPFLDTSGPGSTLGVSISKNIIPIRGPVGVSPRGSY